MSIDFQWFLKVTDSSRDSQESRRISYPLDNACDDLDSPAARSFRDRLRSLQALEKGLKALEIA